MKLGRVLPLLCLALAGCASAQKSDPNTASSATVTSAETPADSKTAAEKWAEKKIAGETATNKQSRESLDPLAMGSELEESMIPNVEITPAREVRAKSAGELNAALGVVKSASSVDAAAQKLTQRLGKPNWTEASKSSTGSKRRIWVAPAGASCQRLVLDPDGNVEIDSAPKSEWRMITGSARQSPCTGEIKRSISNK